jgi:serine phosphatase RsbU (regulator of sigma subunit)
MWPVKDEKMHASELRSIPLFTSLPEHELERLAESLRQQTVDEGTLVYTEGEQREDFYVILEGEVEVIKALGTPDQRLLARRSAGSFLGEMSLFSQDGHHTASVRARTPLKLLKMRQGDLGALIERQPSFAYELLRTLSVRLEESENLTLEDFREKNRQLTIAYEELKAAQSQIIEKEKLERELEVARTIQRSLLPRAVPQQSGFDFGARMIPMSEVGGDFYDFIPLSENRLGIAVGDVSDHGVPSALLMAQTVTLLRSEARRTDSPKEALLRINQQLIEHNELGMFVTLLFGCLDVTTRQLDYIRAGHEPPMILTAKGAQVEVPMQPGQPLGLVPEPALDEGTLQLPASSLLMMYTDGVTETQNQDGGLYGHQGLLDSLTPAVMQPALVVCDQVLESLSVFRNAARQSDDITVLAVKIGQNDD